MLLAHMDRYGKAAWLGMAALAFWTAWPLGLAIFAFLMGSGRTRAWREEMHHSPGRSFNMRGAAEGMAIWPSTAAARSRGDNAFDADCKAEFDHLEKQGKEFKAFLDWLRLARDKDEFDGFMAEQRQAVATRPPPEHDGA